MTIDSPKLEDKTPTVEAPKAAEPKTAEPKATEAADSLAGASKSTQEANQWFEETDKFVRSVATNLRYGSWTMRFVTIGGAAIVGLNPVSAGKVAELFGVKELPKEYPTAFALGLAGLTVGAVGAAVVTLPKRRSMEPVAERQAIKGLRSFELKDAEIFKRLERQKDVQDCLAALEDKALRLGILTGESGAGKSSLLQAGVMPRLGDSGFEGVCVKLGDREPIGVIRRALKGTEGEEFVPMLTGAVERAGKPIVLILDQFEQFFVQFQEAERGAFVEALKAWYASEVSVKILIGIRGDLSDRLLEIQQALGYSLRPNQSVRLEKFSPEQATNVLDVIAQTEGLAFNRSFVLEVARDELAGKDGKVLPVDVQILAQMISRETEEGRRSFDKGAFLKLGGVEGLLGRSLTRSLAAMPIKAERDRILEVLLALTDLERNVRAGAFSVAGLRGMEGKVQGTPEEVGATVNWLVEARLITPVEGDDGPGNEQASEQVYELAHERLIPALRQVANRELTEANRANLLLDQRVNEWIGSGKNGRYLFGLGELRLLRRQRGFLAWGQRELQKRELVRRSWGRGRLNLGLLSTPVVVGVMFGVWSHMPPGQIQWARWQLMDVDRLINLDDIRYNEHHRNLFTALTLDAITAAKGTFPMAHYFGWEAPISFSMSMPLQETGKILGDLKDLTVAKQLLEQELVIVQANYDASTKSNGLATIADSYIKLKDNRKAATLLAQSVDVAKAIQDEESKVSALSSIAEVYIKLNDQPKAASILSRSIDVAKAMQNERSKVSALHSIAGAYIKLNDNKKVVSLLIHSINVAKAIHDAESRALAFRPFNTVYVQADNSPIFTSFLRLTEVYIKLNDQPKAFYFLTQSIDATKTIQTIGYKASIFRPITEASVKLNDKAKTASLLSQSLDIAKAIEYENDKVSVLGLIVEASIKVNDKKKAASLLSQSIDVAKTIQGEYYKVSALSSIAEASIKINGKKKAASLFSLPIDIAKAIQIDSDKVLAFGAIAEAYIKLNDKAKAAAILDQSIDVAKAIQGEDGKVSALSSIAEAYIKLNDKAKAAALLAQSIDVAKAIQNEDSRVSALRSIAEAYIKLNDKAKAAALLAQSIDVAKTIQSEYSKASALRSIAEAYIKLNTPEKARALLKETDKSCQFGEVYAGLGDWGNALNAAQLCDADRKVSVLARILRVHAEQQHPEFKALREE